MDSIDRHTTNIVLAITKATNIPQLLPYMRKKLLAEITYWLNNNTDEEIEEYYKEHMGKDETNKERQI